MGHSHPWRQILLALFAYCCLCVFGGWYIYGSVDGVSAIMGEAAGAFLLPGILAFVVSRKKPSIIAFTGAIAVSLLVVLSSNFAKIKSAYDAHTYLSEMSNSTPDNYVDVLNKSKTDIGTALAALRGKAQEQQDKIGNILIGIQDDSLRQMLDASTLKDKEKMARMSAVAQRKLESALAAGADIDAVVSAMRGPINQTLDKFSSKEKTEAIDGFYKTNNQVVALEKEYASLFADIYKQLALIYSALDQNSGKYTVVGDAQISFSDPEAVQKYNAELSAMKQDYQRITEIQSEWKKIQERSANLIRGIE